MCSSLTLFSITQARASQGIRLRYIFVPAGFTFGLLITLFLSFSFPDIFPVVSLCCYEALPSRFSLLSFLSIIHSFIHLFLVRIFLLVSFLSPSHLGFIGLSSVRFFAFSFSSNFFVYMACMVTRCHPCDRLSHVIQSATMTTISMQVPHRPHVTSCVPFD